MLHDDGVYILEMYEASKTPITQGELDTEMYPGIASFAELLYIELVTCVSGEPSKFITNQRRGQGIVAWRELAQYYDSCSKRSICKDL